MLLEVSYLLIALLSYYLIIRLRKQDSTIRKNSIAVLVALTVTGVAYILPTVIYVTSGVISMTSKDTQEKRAKIEFSVQEWFLNNNVSDVYIEISGRTYDEITLESPMFTEDFVNRLTVETEIL